MHKKLVLIGCFIMFVLLSTVGSAASPYLDIQVYYNDVMYPGTSTPKPFVKIDEPFTLRFDVTVNQECQVYEELSDLGVYQGIESFTVIEGPSKLGEDVCRVLEENETFTYEWTLKPTERWAGGSMPIDFHYEVQLKERYGSVVSSEFTAAYVTISNEHYDGPETPAASLEQSPNTSSSPTIPAFTLLGALAAMCMVYALRKL